MIDLNVMNEDLILKDGDFELTTQEGSIISNAISVFISTHFGSYPFDSDFGVDIQHMESITNPILMIYFINASLKWYIDQRIISNFEIKDFQVNQNENKTHFKLIINHIKNNEISTISQ